MPTGLSHILRADAEDNRDRILDAARTLFAQRGLEVPMREIARLAEVGPATLYRRFPTKQDLINVAFRDELVACSRIVDEGCADPDAWRGFCSVVAGIGELNARNQGFTDAFLELFPNAIDFAAHRSEMLWQLAGLAERAKDAGALRADFVLDDLLLVFMAARGVATASKDRRITAARRFAALAIDGFRAESATQLPPAARVSAVVLASART